MKDAAIQTLFPECWLVHIREAATKGQLLAIPERIGNQSHAEAFFGFRRVFGDRKAQILVNPAVQVREIQLDFIWCGLQGHERPPLRKGAQSTAKRSSPILAAAFDTVGTNGKIRSSENPPTNEL